jgi:hypothetical protein
MKLHGFTGLEHSFTICLDDRDIEVTDIDYKIFEDELRITAIDVDGIFDLYELADIMFSYIDWSAVEQEKLDNYNQMREDEMMEG